MAEANVEKKLVFLCPVEGCFRARGDGDLGLCTSHMEDSQQCENCLWVLSTTAVIEGKDERKLCESCEEKCKRIGATCPVKICRHEKTVREYGACGNHLDAKKCEICFRVMAGTAKWYKSLAMVVCRECVDRMVAKNDLDDNPKYKDLWSATAGLEAGRKQAIKASSKRHAKKAKMKKRYVPSDSEDESDEELGEDEVPDDYESDGEREAREEQEEEDIEEYYSSSWVKHERDAEMETEQKQERKLRSRLVKSPEPDELDEKHNFFTPHSSPFLSFQSWTPRFDESQEINYPAVRRKGVKETTSDFLPGLRVKSFEEIVAQKRQAQARTLAQKRLSNQTPPKEVDGVVDFTS